MGVQVTRERVRVDARAGERKRLQNVSGATVLYGDAEVNEATFEGALDPGEEVVIDAPRWLISTGQSEVSIGEVREQALVVELEATRAALEERIDALEARLGDYASKTELRKGLNREAQARLSAINDVRNRP